MTLPAKTVINVRLTTTIDADASQAGMPFKAIVDDPVLINGNIVVPRNAVAMLQAVKVEQSGNFKGADKITLKMDSISRSAAAHSRWPPSTWRAPARERARRPRARSVVAPVLARSSEGSRAAAPAPQSAQQRAPRRARSLRVSR